MKRVRAAIAPLLWVLVCGVSPSARAAAPAPGKRPRLVVLLSIDQMRADYVDDYGAEWKHGLHTLLQKGAYFRNARYPYLETVTCPGHSTLGTGAYPHRHGMILNTWWDRARKKLVECTEDLDAPLVFYGKPGAGEGDSARNMMVNTLADEMKAQLTPAPRVVSFSFKARSAIGLVGHKADVAVWFEGGSWVTSKAYAGAPDPAVAKIVGGYSLDAAVAKGWQRELPAAAYKGADDAAEEKPAAGWTRVFPHELKSADPAAARRLWGSSALTDEALAGFAVAAVGQLGLGRGPGTDVLAVSFSALDMVGHSFGPRSHEVQDVLARLDRLISDLLQALDTQVGRDRYVLAWSADHGVAAYPADLKAEGKDAGRIDFELIRRKLTAAVEAELGPGETIADLYYTDLYLAPGVMERLRAKAGALARVLSAVRSVPGVLEVFAADELGDPAKATDPLRRAAALSYYPGRSGDLILVPRPYWLTVSAGTTHGTQNDYDQRVPLVFFGAGVKPGRHDRAVSPADLAPTLARMVGVSLPAAEGAPLEEILAR